MLAWLIAFLLTCAVEVPVVVALAKRDAAVRIGRLVVVAFGLQATHPLLWLIDPPSLGWLLVAEVVIVLVEGLLLWHLALMPGPTVALLVALIANGASFAVGLLLAPLLASIG